MSHHGIPRTVRDCIHKAWACSQMTNEQHDELAAELTKIESERDSLRKRVEELERALCSLYSAITTLMEESEGVAGLHKNGDIATWAELDTGGQFENWLGPYLRRASELLDQPAPHEGEEG